MRYFWTLLFISFSIQANEHLYPLGENGIYYYKDTEKLVDNIKPKNLDVQAIHIVYPSGKNPSILIVNETWQTNEFSITIAKDISEPELARTFTISREIAKKILKAISNVITTIRIPDEPLLGVDGTEYVFYQYPYGGFTWGKRKSGSRKVTALIEVFEILFDQIDSKNDFSLNDKFIVALDSLEKQT